MPSIFITGANRGIGLELTRHFAHHGWTVHACCRSPENSYDLMKAVSTAKGMIQLHTLDVTNALQRQSLAAQLAGEPIDILLNNAGVYGDWEHQAFGTSSATEWERTLNINALAPLQMMESFAENVAHSERKIIANMSSKMASMADNSSGGSYLYRASKAALNAITVSAARDLAAKGITVVALHPGWVRTDMGGENGELSVTESTTQLYRTLSTLTPTDNARFIDINGADLPW